MAYPGDIQATLVSASTKASTMLQKPNALINTVTVDNGREGEGYKEVGDTVKYTYPTVDKANATNIGSGSHSPAAIGSGTTSVQLDIKYSSSRYVKTFDQTKSGVQDLINFALRPCIEEVLQKLNGDIGAKMVSANFNHSALPSITGGTDQFSRANLNTGYFRLRGLGVPMIYGDVFFATAGTVVGNMGNLPEFYQAAYISDDVAKSVSIDSLPARFCHTIIVPDDDVPAVASKYNALMYHRGAIVARTAYEAPLNSAYIQETWVNARNIPVHITVGPDQLNSGWLVTASALLGLAVARKEFGQLFVGA